VSATTNSNDDPHCSLAMRYPPRVLTKLNIKFPMEDLVYVMQVQEPAPNKSDVLMQSVQFLRLGDRKVYSSRVFELNLYKKGQVVGLSQKTIKDKEYDVLHPMVSKTESRKADKAIQAASTEEN